LERNIDKLRNIEGNIDTYHSELMVKLVDEKNKMEDIRTREIEQFKKEMTSAKNN
jgi:hypothetical protein